MEKNNDISFLTIDEEFENLISPIADIEAHRIRFAVMMNRFAQIRAWNNIVLCDSNVYKLCRDYKIPCEVIKKDFANRNEAISYVCTEELKRDDLTHEYKKYLIGKIYNAEKRGTISIKITRMSIASKVGTAYSISAGAVQKYGVYAEAIDRIFEITSDLARFVLEGKLRISHENTIELARLPKEELITVMQITKEKSTGRMSFADLKHEIRWKNYTASSRTHSRVRKEEGEIKKMPMYDPDADIMSIAMTIPSWINAINRAVEHTDIIATTEKGRKALRDQLCALDDAIIKVINIVEV